LVAESVAMTTIEVLYSSESFKVEAWSVEEQLRLFIRMKFKVAANAEVVLITTNIITE
jgi:hypothetical protein